jgi:hypothetical protein
MNLNDKNKDSKISNADTIGCVVFLDCGISKNIVK